MIARLALRIFLLSLAAALVAGVAYLSVAALPLRPSRNGLPAAFAHRRRPLGPQPRRADELVKELLLVGMITFAGKKTLRLRL